MIATVCMLMSKNFDREKRKWILHMLMATAILLISDAFAWGYRGNSGILGFYIVRISNFLVFLFSDVIMALFHGYVCCCLFGGANAKKTKNVELQVKAVYMIALIAMGLVILTQFTGLYYTFDAHNLYHRSNCYFMALVLPMIGMIIDCNLIIRYRKQISGRLMVSMLSYIFLPLVTTMIQIFYYGISLINIAISISMILMFIEAMIEQARTVAEQARIVAEQERMISEQKLELAETERKVAEQNRKIAEQNRELTETRIATMMSQIKPHFIYNTLGSIEQLCELDPAMAEKMVHNFAKYLRGNFGELDNKRPIRMSQEITHCKYYVSIEQVRFPDIKIIFDIQIDDFQIPALSVQPLIENAIKHGLMKLPKGGSVWISSYETEDTYCVKVEDNGVGFDTSALLKDRKQIGLRNIQGRLQAMCNGTLTVKSSYGMGTRVLIQIPKKRGSDMHVCNCS